MQLLTKVLAQELPKISIWLKDQNRPAARPFKLTKTTTAPKRHYPDFVVKLTNGTHVVVETKGQKDKSAQIKRKALQGWVKAVNSIGTWGRWGEVFSTHPGDLEGLLEKLI